MLLGAPQYRAFAQDVLGDQHQGLGVKPCPPRPLDVAALCSASNKNLHRAHTRALHLPQWPPLYLLLKEQQQPGSTCSRGRLLHSPQACLGAHKGCSEQARVADPGKSNAPSIRTQSGQTVMNHDRGKKTPHASGNRGRG